MAWGRDDRRIEVGVAPPAVAVFGEQLDRDGIAERGDEE